MKQTFDRNAWSRGLLVLALSASLAACSSNESTENATSGQSAAPTVMAEPASTPRSSGELAQGNDEFAVTQAWIRAAPPGAMMLAGYFTLANRGGETRQLVGSRSDAFGDVSIHRSFVEDGVSKMRPAGDLDIDSGATLTFEPGGLHLMLMSPRSDVSPGQHIPIWLCFADGEDVEEVLVEFVVSREAP